jgi:hypothetical protein
MTTRVEKSIQVDVPLSTAYNKWTQFEDFPHFMGGVQEVRQLDDRRLHWVVEIAGVRREWEASILEQVPYIKVAWARTRGATNAGAVRFEPAGASSTIVYLTLEYEPEGVVEQVGDKLGIVERQVRSDLERFKALIESEGYESGAWRGSINEGVGVGTPGVEHAAGSEGDSGKAGLSGKAVAAGVAVAAAGVAAATAAARSSSGSEESTAAGTGLPVAETAVVPEPAVTDVVVEETVVFDGTAPADTTGTSPAPATGVVGDVPDDGTTSGRPV